MTPLPPPPHLHAALVHQGKGAVAFHQHPCTELILVEDGDISVSCQDQDLCGRAHSLIVTPPRILHDQTNRGQWHTHCVLYSGGEHLLSSRPRVLNLHDDPLARRWITDLVELTASGDARDGAGDGLLVTLLTRMGARDERDASAAMLPPPVTTALRFLHEYLGRELSNDQVAQAAGISVSHLGAMFRSHFGCGPLQHLQRLRLERAARLLRNPYLRIPEIARTCGYRDVNFFIRHFRRAHGLPPGRWRQQQASSG